MRARDSAGDLSEGESAAPVPVPVPAGDTPADSAPEDAPAESFWPAAENFLTKTHRGIPPPPLFVEIQDSLPLVAFGAPLPIIFPEPFAMYVGYTI